MCAMKSTQWHRQAPIKDTNVDCYIRRDLHGNVIFAFGILEIIYLGHGAILCHSFLDKYSSFTSLCCERYGQAEEKNKKNI